MVIRCSLSFNFVNIIPQVEYHSHNISITSITLASHVVPPSAVFKK